jgi:hypothetical protein
MFSSSLITTRTCSTACALRPGPRGLPAGAALVPPVRNLPAAP